MSAQNRAAPCYLPPPAPEFSAARWSVMQLLFDLGIIGTTSDRAKIEDGR
jgi:hypothetical protein